MAKKGRKNKYKTYPSTSSPQGPEGPSGPRTAGHSLSTSYSKILALSEDRAKRRTSRSVEIKEIIKEAKKALAELTGFKDPRGIGVKKTGKEWRVRCEITEKTSIPEAMDVLGIYDIRLDSEGNILDYERKGLKRRADVEAKIEEAET